MLSKSMQAALNDHVQKELYSAYLYLSMSCHFEANNLPGFAHWMRLQFAEEQSHALKLVDFVNARGGRITLQPVAAPPAEWKSSLELFRQVLEHEQKITQAVGALYAAATEEKDYATQIMLQWFVSEQVEEEKNVAEIIGQLELIEARGTAVLMLDHRLGKRDK